MMRIIIIAALVACDRDAGRPAVPGWPGIHVPEASTGASTTGEDMPRLDLPSWPDLPADGATGGTSTGAPTTGGEGTSTTGASSGTTAAGTSTGGSTSTTGGTSTTGAESSSGSTGEPLSPCPCEPAAAESLNFCGLSPGACEATTPGGYCDPDGDGNFADGDWNLGWQEWTAKCA